MKLKKQFEVYTNAKTKHYSNGATNTTCCRVPIFKDPFNEDTKKNLKELSDAKLVAQNIQNKIDYLDARQISLEEWYERRKEFLKNQTKEEKSKSDRVRYDSLKRAKDNIFDYILNNDFDYFFTGTINPENLDSENPRELWKPVQKWLQNMVQRYNMHYIVIAELHKSGRIHFHGLFKADNLKLIDSGTKLYKGFNKPISNEKAERLGLTEGKTVYNLATWKFGFSTCIRLYGDRMKTAFYVTKYITKDCKKIFGKFFWHSQNIKKPVIEYSNMDFYAIDALDNNGFKYIFEGGNDDKQGKDTDI